MASQNDLVIIVMGHKPSPLVKYIVDRDDIPVTWVCSNVLDFQLHHADPFKASTYHLEFTNLLDQKARNYIESLAIFETLGKFLDFYNPFKLSTLNYLITRYITSINPSLKGLSSTWWETVKSIFGDDTIFPLFEESRVLHVKVDGVEIPARQYLISRETEKSKENGGTGKSRKTNDAKESPGNDVSGIVDIDEIRNFKLCSESIKRIEQSQGVLFVPTDLLSFHVLAQCEEFTEALKKPESKVALVSPFWEGADVTSAERDILLRLGIEPTLVALANKLKSFADAIIIDEKDASMLQQLRETGMTVLVENMSPTAQATEQFLERVLKTVSVDLESIKSEHPVDTISLGEKIVSIFSERLSHKQGKENTEKGVSSPLTPQVPQEITPPVLATTQAQQAQTAAVGTSTDSLIPTAAIPLIPSISGTTTTPGTVETVPPTAKAPSQAVDPTHAAVDVMSPSQTLGTAAVHPIPKMSAVIPVQAPQQASAGSKVQETGIHQIQGAVPTQAKVIDSKPVPAQARTSDEAKIEEIAPNLFDDIDKVLYPKYDATIEAIFSSLLSILDQPRLVPAIFKILVGKLGKLDELNPEARTIDIITYLAAHNPEAYSELFSELLSEVMKEEDNVRFEELLHMISLIMGASQVKRQEVLRNFIKENMAVENDFAIERTRKILNYFMNKNPVFAVIICKTLIEFMIAELENVKASVKTINNLAFFLLSIDAILLGETIVIDMPEALHVKVKAILESISSGQVFNNIVINIIDAYQAGEYETLKKALNVKKVPASIQMAVLKRKYMSQLLKAGSVPLEMFAEKLGMSMPEAEKLIYDAILKGDIAAKMEVVGGKLYIVKDENKEKESDK